MMKVLITGAGGQLGWDVMKELERRNIDCCGVDVADFDITDMQATRESIWAYAPDAVIHCSAYTAVDKAEDDVERCTAVNVEGTRNIAVACRKIGAKLIYISTDYVFPGTGTEPYEIGDRTGPESVYGKTKLAGEMAVRELADKLFIVRISWAFGKNGSNFVKIMLRLGKERDEVRVVDDQIGSPTYTADLASLLCDMAQSDKYGIYHASNEGYCSFAEFAEEIFRQASYTAKVVPIPTSQYPARAIRPFNSRLSKRSLDKAGFNRLPDWKDALSRYLKEINAI